MGRFDEVHGWTLFATVAVIVIGVVLVAMVVTSPQTGNLDLQACVEAGKDYIDRNCISR